ncbi:MAG: 3-coathanger stack domain-containing protein [Bacteroidota bacterium]
MKQLILLVGLLGVLCVSPTNAQINIGGEPYSFHHTLTTSKSKFVKTMPPINRQQLDKEDKIDKESGMPPRFGFPFPTKLNLQNSGEWSILDNGDHIWRLTIECPNARSINLTYSDFWLPNGASLYIYNADRSSMIGGFTSVNNKGLQKDLTPFSTGLVYGEQITLEYYEPSSVLGQGQIAIDQVVHGYRLTNPFEEGFEKLFGDAANCQNNINCPVGDDYQGEKRAVAMIMVGGIRWCSGALLNSWGNESIPYLLTADHCLAGLDATDNTNANNWVFFFNYESPNCTNPTSDPLSNATSVSGAVLLSNLEETDFALLRLLERPRGVAYLGWDANGPEPESGVGIHHPSGDVMKISVENDKVASFDDWIRWTDATYPAHSHWKVNYDDGGMEGGSSGSPFLDQHSRVVGQLTGGTASCQTTSYYGKLSVSWNGRGSDDRRRRLGDWIGPTCTSYRDITNSFLGEEPIYRANKINARNQVGQNAFVRYEGTNYVDLKEGFDAESGADFMASIGTGCTSKARGKNRPSAVANTVLADGTELNHRKKFDNYDVLEARSTTNVQHTNVSIAPNPASIQTTVAFDIPKEQQLSLELHNAYGQRIRVLMPSTFYEAGTHQIQVNTEDLSSGSYWVVMTTAKEVISKPVVILNN